MLKDLADGVPVSAEDIARLKKYLIDTFNIKGLRDKEFELKVKGKNLLQMYVDFVIDSNYEPYYGLCRGRRSLCLRVSNLPAFAEIARSKVGRPAVMHFG